MGLYLLCLLLPAYETFTGPKQGTVHSGAEALFTGVGGLLGANFSWLSNPMLWASWWKARKKAHARALVWSLCSLGVALSFLVTDKINFLGFGSATFTIGAGYYVWLLAIACQVAASALRHFGKGAPAPVPESEQLPP